MERGGRPASETPLEMIAADRAQMRCGSARIELCQGGAAQWRVNAMVEAGRATHKNLGHLKGLTNAVLRKIAAEGLKAGALRSPRFAQVLRGRLPRRGARGK